MATLQDLLRDAFQASNGNYENAINSVFKNLKTNSIWTMNNKQYALFATPQIYKGSISVDASDFKSTEFSLPLSEIDGSGNSLSLSTPYNDWTQGKALSLQDQFRNMYDYLTNIDPIEIGGRLSEDEIDYVMDSVIQAKKNKSRVVNNYSGSGLDNAINFLNSDRGPINMNTSASPPPDNSPMGKLNRIMNMNHADKKMWSNRNFVFGDDFVNNKDFRSAVLDYYSQGDRKADLFNKLARFDDFSPDKFYLGAYENMFEAYKELEGLDSRGLQEKIINEMKTWNMSEGEFQAHLDLLKDGAEFAGWEGSRDFIDYDPSLYKNTPDTTQTANRQRRRGNVEHRTHSAPNVPETPVGPQRGDQFYDPKRKRQYVYEGPDEVFEGQHKFISDQGRTYVGNIDDFEKFTDESRFLDIDEMIGYRDAIDTMHDYNSRSLGSDVYKDPEGFWKGAEDSIKKVNQYEQNIKNKIKYHRMDKDSYTKMNILKNKINTWKNKNTQQTSTNTPKPDPNKTFNTWLEEHKKSGLWAKATSADETFHRHFAADEDASGKVYGSNSDQKWLMESWANATDDEINDYIKRLANEGYSKKELAFIKDELQNNRYVGQYQTLDRFVRKTNVSTADKFRVINLDGTQYALLTNGNMGSGDGINLQGFNLETGQFEDIGDKFFGKGTMEEQYKRFQDVTSTMEYKTQEELSNILNANTGNNTNTNTESERTLNNNFNGRRDPKNIKQNITDSIFTKFRNPGEQTARIFNYDGKQYALYRGLGIDADNLNKGITRGDVVDLETGKIIDARDAFHKVNQALIDGDFETAMNELNNFKEADHTWSRSKLEDFILEKNKNNTQANQESQQRGQEEQRNRTRNQNDEQYENFNNTQQETKEETNQQHRDNTDTNKEHQGRDTSGDNNRQDRNRYDSDTKTRTRKQKLERTKGKKIVKGGDKVSGRKFRVNKKKAKGKDLNQILINTFVNTAMDTADETIETMNKTVNKTVDDHWKRVDMKHPDQMTDAELANLTKEQFEEYKAFANGDQKKIDEWTQRRNKQIILDMENGNYHEPLYQDNKNPRTYRMRHTEYDVDENGEIILRKLDDINEIEVEANKRNLDKIKTKRRSSGNGGLDDVFDWMKSHKIGMLDIGWNVISTIGDYKESRRQGHGVFSSALRAAGSFAFNEMIGFWGGLALGAAKGIPKLAIKGAELLYKENRKMNSAANNQVFGNAEFYDTQQLATMRQSGMEMAKMAQYNLQQTLMGNEATYLHR